MSGSKSSLANPLLVDSGCQAHSVQFYGEDESLVNALVAFIAPALHAGEPAVVVATPEHRIALASGLSALGVDVRAASCRGRYLALDAEETLALITLEGWPDPVRFTHCIGDVLKRARAAEGAKPNSPVAVFGEMVALLWSKGRFEAAVQLEELWNELSRTNDIHLRCAYPVRALALEGGDAFFQKVCAEHSHVLPMPISAREMADKPAAGLTHWQQRASLEVETAGRKRLQRALLSRESELVDLLENAVEGAQRIGPDQRVLWANPALLRLLGYRPEEYVGHRFADFFTDSAKAEDLWAKLMRREEVHDFAAEVRCHDGSVRHVSIQSNGLWDGDRFMHTRTFVHDMTERIQMEQALQQARQDLERRVEERTAELREKNEQISRQTEKLDRTIHGLRELSARLMRVQDDERRRIARDLHDGVGQSLALLSMNLSTLHDDARRAGSDLAPGLAENAAIVKQISTELRTLSYLLHPPLLDEMGLDCALRWFIDGFAQRSNIKVNLELPEPLGRLSEDLEIAIFRVVQECLTNVHRHSGSATAAIRLYEASGSVVLEVHDEGRGIAPEQLAQISSVGAPGVGLRGMRERIKDFGGELEVTSDGRGTMMRMVIPDTTLNSGLEVSETSAG